MRKPRIRKITSAKETRPKLKQDRFWVDARKNCFMVRLVETNPAVGSQGAPVAAGEGEG